MKRILLACFLVAAASSAVLAQSKSAASTSTQAESKQLFSSKINELSATVSRNRTEQAQKIFMEIAAMMQTRIAEDNRALASASSEAEKTALKNKIKAEQDIYTEVKMMSVDMVKNNDQIKSKLTSFLKNY